MTLFINVLLAWIAVISAILLSIIWALRIIQNNIPKGENKDLIIKINKSLRKKHIDLGYVFIVSSFF
ncbi:MAG: FMN-binding protein, partial [Peptostreptococcaceae bacterium]